MSCSPKIAVVGRPCKPICLFNVSLRIHNMIEAHTLYWASITFPLSNISTYFLVFIMLVARYKTIIPDQSYTIFKVFRGSYSILGFHQTYSFVPFSTERVILLSSVQRIFGLFSVGHANVLTQSSICE